MNTIDLIIFIAYCLLILCVGLFVSRDKKGGERDAGDYFLAGRGLVWWAIGASIIASNISAEQFVGMSGSGYAIGLAMATYEWIAALGLILVAKFFIPIFLEKKIFTMPQFLEERFDKRVKTVMAVFWLAVGWSRPISPSTSSEKVAACTREWSTSMARRAISSI